MLRHRIIPNFYAESEKVDSEKMIEMLLDIVKRRVRKNGLTVLSVFQDINLAAIYCDEIIFMKNGEVVATGKTDKMMDETLIEKVFHIQSEIRFEPLYQAKQAIFKIGVN